MDPVAEHRVSLLGASFRRFEDPLKSRDPRVKAVVAALKQVEIAPAPRAHFRAELRTQLVAIAPRLVSEGVAAESAMVDIVPRPAEKEAPAPEPAAAHATGSWLRAIPIARPLGIVTALVAAFLVVLGGAVWMSQKALPGDALYGLKRASENVELQLASSPQDRAQDYLDFAATRVDEARALVGRTSAMGSGVNAGGISAHTASLITSTLASADSDVKNASQLLGSQAVKTDSARPLNAMTAWAPSQLQRLRELAAVLPNDSLRARTMTSTHLVSAALHRAKTLAAKVNCGAAATSGSDDLGPVPASSCTTPSAKPVRPSSTGHKSGRHHSSSGQQPGSVTLPSVPAVVGGGSSGTKGGTSGSSAGGATSSTHTPPIVLPTLPNPLPTQVQPSVGLTKCGLAANLGKLIIINIDLCKLLGGTPHPTGTG